MAAKDASPEGEWLSDDYFRSAVDPGTAKRLDLFLANGLLAREDDGRVVVPHYDEWQASDRELPAARRDADTDDRIHRQWRDASKRYRANKSKAPASYDASSQVKKEGSKEPSMTDASDYEEELRRKLHEKYG